MLNILPATSHRLSSERERERERKKETQRQREREIQREREREREKEKERERQIGRRRGKDDEIGCLGPQPFCIYDVRTIVLSFM